MRLGFEGFRPSPRALIAAQSAGALHEQRRDRGRKRRLAEIEPLRLGTVLSFEERELLVCFNALRHHAHVKIPAHRDDGVHDACILRVDGEISNE